MRQRHPRRWGAFHRLVQRRRVPVHRCHVPLPGERGYRLGSRVRHGLVHGEHHRLPDGGGLRERFRRLRRGAAHHAVGHGQARLHLRLLAQCAGCAGQRPSRVHGDRHERRRVHRVLHAQLLWRDAELERRGRGRAVGRGRVRVRPGGAHSGAADRRSTLRRLAAGGRRRLEGALRRRRGYVVCARRGPGRVPGRWRAGA